MILFGMRSYGGDIYLHTVCPNKKHTERAVAEAKKKIQEIVKNEPFKEIEKGIIGTFRDAPRIEVVTEEDFTRVSWRVTMLLNQESKEDKEYREKLDIWGEKNE